MTNKMPRAGRLVLTPMLNPKGKLIGDFTIAKADDERFLMWGSSQAQKYHMRWFEQHLPDDGSVSIAALRHGAGRPVDRRPEVARRAAAAHRRRRLRRRLQVHRPSGDGHRQRAGAGQPGDLYRRSRLRDLGGAGISAPALPGDHGGRAATHGIVNFGMRALLSLRLEKNFPTWYRELRPIYGAVRGRARPLRRPDQERLHRPRRGGGGEATRAASCAASRMVVDAADADVLGDEPIWHDGKVVGWVTSGGYGHYRRQVAGPGLCARRSSPARRAEGAFEIEIIGDRRKATIITEPLFDPEGQADADVGHESPAPIASPARRWVFANRRRRRS